MGRGTIYREQHQVREKKLYHSRRGAQRDSQACSCSGDVLRERGEAGVARQGRELGAAALVADCGVSLGVQTSGPEAQRMCPGTRMQTMDGNG